MPDRDELRDRGEELNDRVANRGRRLNDELEDRQREAYSGGGGEAVNVPRDSDNPIAPPEEETIPSDLSASGYGDGLPGREGELRSTGGAPGSTDQAEDRSPDPDSIAGESSWIGRPSSDP